MAEHILQIAEAAEAAKRMCESYRERLPEWSEDDSQTLTKALDQSASISELHCNDETPNGFMLRGFAHLAQRMQAATLDELMAHERFEHSGACTLYLRKCWRFVASKTTPEYCAALSTQDPSADLQALFGFAKDKVLSLLEEAVKGHKGWTWHPDLGRAGSEEGWEALKAYIASLQLYLIQDGTSKFAMFYKHVFVTTAVIAEYEVADLDLMCTELRKRRQYSYREELMVALQHELVHAVWRWDGTREWNAQYNDTVFSPKRCDRQALWNDSGFCFEHEVYRKEAAFDPLGTQMLSSWDRK
mmetsp:Transcript_54494/g.100812  ORF Transcript_54494/g.100812 Transcript_54494/m.100812 type:complete len:301 (+) Transcript_54494:59-961(+)